MNYAKLNGINLLYPLFCLMATAVCLEAEEITLQEGLDDYAGTSDTWTREDSASANYGEDGNLRVRASATGNDRTTLISFDLSQLEALGEVQINSATLSLYWHYNRYAGIAEMDIYRMKREWVEGSGGSSSGASWLRWDSGTDAAADWTARPDGADGGLGTGDHETTPTASVSLSTSNVGSWVEIDVTADVAAFMSGTEHWGWLLVETSSNIEWAFFSSDNADNPSLRPMLVVDYTVIPEASSATLVGGCLVLVFTSVMLRTKYRKN